MELTGLEIVMGGAVLSGMVGIGMNATSIAHPPGHLVGSQGRQRPVCVRRGGHTHG
jgi:hypothetical protein